MTLVITNVFASPETYKTKMEEILGYTIEDKTTGDPKFKELQRRIQELRYSDGGNLQEKTEELINLTLQLYPEVSLNFGSTFIVYGIGELLYVYATPGTYDNRRFIYDSKGLIEWAYNWYDTAPGKVNFLEDTILTNIIYCAGQKIIFVDWDGNGYKHVVNDYRYVPWSEGIYSLSLYKNGNLLKTVEPTIVNDPFNFRKKAQAATVNGTYHRLYDLDPDMIPYSQMRLLINDLLSSD